LDTVIAKLKIQDIYTVQTGYQYKIRNVTFPDDSSALSREIQNTKSRPCSKPVYPTAWI